MEFDLIGLDASLANALRRILMAEIPTMAIEKVYVYNNTSVMHDEILAHRLGLVPIKADPRLFEFKEGEGDGATDLNTLVFKLHVECKKNSQAAGNALDPKEKYINSNSMFFLLRLWKDIKNTYTMHKYSLLVGPGMGTTRRAT